MTEQMKDKTFVVTGGNAGIGKAIVLSLAQKKHHVVLVSRNEQKGLDAVAEIKQESNHDDVELAVGDLGSVASTNQLADLLLKRYAKIGVLVNNAGIWPTKLQMNADNLEMSFMVNHLAPFILSNRLLSTLKVNAPARIVNVNAGLYVNGKYDPDKTPYGKDFNRMRTYANTKLCNVLFTREFAQRIEGSGVTINALHPGVIRTSLGDFSGILGMLLRLVKRSWGSPEEGAKPPVWLATSPEVEGINGQYYDLQKPIDVNEIASDVELGKRLWEQSVAFAKLGNID